MKNASKKNLIFIAIETLAPMLICSCSSDQFGSPQSKSVQGGLPDNLPEWASKISDAVIDELVEPYVEVLKSVQATSRESANPPLDACEAMGVQSTSRKYLHARDDMGRKVPSRESYSRAKASPAMVDRVFTPLADRLRHYASRANEYYREKLNEAPGSPFVASLTEESDKCYTTVASVLDDAKELANKEPGISLASFEILVRVGATAVTHCLDTAAYHKSLWYSQCSPTSNDEENCKREFVEEACHDLTKRIIGNERTMAGNPPLFTPLFTVTKNDTHASATQHLDVEFKKDNVNDGTIHPLYTLLSLALPFTWTFPVGLPNAEEETLSWPPGVFLGDVDRMVTPKDFLEHDYGHAFVRRNSDHRTLFGQSCLGKLAMASVLPGNNESLLNVLPVNQKEAHLPFELVQFEKTPLINKESLKKLFKLRVEQLLTSLWYASKPQSQEDTDHEKKFLKIIKFLASIYHEENDLYEFVPLITNINDPDHVCPDERNGGKSVYVADLELDMLSNWEEYTYQRDGAKYKTTHAGITLLAITGGSDTCHSASSTTSAGGSSSTSDEVPYRLSLIDFLSDKAY